MYVLCNLILKEKSFTHYSHWDCCCCNQWQNSKGGTEKKWRIMFVECQAKAVIEKSFYSEVTPNSGSSRSQANDVTRRSRYLLRTLFINAMYVYIICTSMYVTLFTRVKFLVSKCFILDMCILLLGIVMHLHLCLK